MCVFGWRANTTTNLFWFFLFYGIIDCALGLKLLVCECSEKKVSIEE